MLIFFVIYLILFCKISYVTECIGKTQKIEFFKRNFIKITELNKPGFRIRIRKDPHIFESKDPDPQKNADPDPQTPKNAEKMEKST